MTRLHLPALGIGIVLWLSAFSAGAQDRDPAAADKLFREAREAMKRGDYASACPKLLESQRLDPAPGTAINLSDCYEKQRKLVDAVRVLRKALDLVLRGDPRVKPLKQQIEALDARVPKLRLSLAAGAPTGTRVSVDGVELAEASLGNAMPLDPGQHAIVVVAPGRVDGRSSVELAEGETKSVTLELGAPEGRAAPEPAKVGEPEPKPERKPEPHVTSGNATLGYVVGGVGILAAGFGGFALAHAHGKKSDSDAAPQGTARDDLYDDAKRWQTISFVSFGVGAAAIATGGWLIFGAKSGDESARSLLRVTPAVGKGQSSLWIEGTW